MNVFLTRMTALKLLPALMLWEEREASSVPVVLGTLETALPVTVRNVTGLFGELLETLQISMSAVLMHTTVHSRLCVQIPVAVLFALVRLDTLEMVLHATVSVEKNMFGVNCVV